MPLKNSIRTQLETLAYKSLLQFPPETAHNLGKWTIKHQILAPGQYIAQKRPSLFGFELNNPLGLAAGFDKNGEISDQIVDYGFAWSEIGSITYYGSEGNNLPRLFRKKPSSLLNRIGLAGKPAHQIIGRLKNTKHPFAINIAKTPRAEIQGDNAVEDIKSTYKLVIENIPQEKLIYTAFDISCPSTFDGKTFETPENLETLLSEIEKIKAQTSILLKLSPNLESKQLRKIIEIADDKVDGYICGNTYQIYDQTQGFLGLSGEELKPYTINLIKTTSDLTTKTIIACGGISTGKDALIAQLFGADFFQVFTGFVYGNNASPRFAHKLLNEFYELKQPFKVKNKVYNNQNIT